jgi:hypothetical protein
MHRSSCSTVEEDLAAATVMDASIRTAIDALRKYDAISKVPRAAGYRGSDFVLWHRPADYRTAAISSAFRGTFAVSARRLACLFMTLAV